MAKNDQCMLFDSRRSRVVRENSNFNNREHRTYSSRSSWEGLVSSNGTAKELSQRNLGAIRKWPLVHLGNWVPQIGTFTLHLSRCTCLHVVILERRTSIIGASGMLHRYSSNGTLPLFRRAAKTTLGLHPLSNRRGSSQTAAITHWRPRFLNVVKAPLEDVGPYHLEETHPRFACEFIRTKTHVPCTLIFRLCTHVMVYIRM